jgi:DNA-binding NtrC family response regulator
VSEKTGKILVVDDNADVLQAARMLLSRQAKAVYTETNPANIPELLKKNEYDVVLLDMNFTREVSSGQEGLDWLRRILEIDQAAVVVMITAYGDIEVAVDSIKSGAFDFVVKPWQNEKLIATVSAALRHRQSNLEIDRLRQGQKALNAEINRPFGTFIGRSPEIKELFADIDKVAATDVSVLITGENGTGKELVAREIHRRSVRKEEVFVKVDVGALNEALFESELFGHVKGAFTDARDERAGRFELASGGTLFLDEISNIPPSLQAKLLTTLELHEVTRVGSNVPKRIDLRLVSATNHSLQDLVASGDFREDLLYRINTVEIHLPPLRERGEDIILLAEFFLDRYRRKYSKAIRQISSEAEARLREYHWPGNVRELQHVIERAVIMSSTNSIQSTDIMLPLPTMPASESQHARRGSLENIEKTTILKALQAHNGNVSKASRELGLTRASLYRRMKKHGI